MSPMPAGTSSALSASRRAVRSSPSIRREMPPARGIVGHEDEVASGQARKRGERRPLLAALLLLHLHQKLLSFRKGVPHRRGFTRFGGPVGVELARDLLEGQEAVPFGSVVDECGLQTGLDPRDPRLVDACLALAARRHLDVEVVEKLTVHHGDPTLLGLGGVDQHSFHCSFRACATVAPRWVAPERARCGERSRERVPPGRRTAAAARAASSPDQTKPRVVTAR